MSRPSDTGRRSTASPRSSSRRPHVIHLTPILALLAGACGQDSIPTYPSGPEQNALVAVVRLQPSEAVIPPDETVSLSALVRGARGQVVNGRPVTWRSSDERVAHIDSNGNVVAGEEGTATITANVLGVEGVATIDVRGTVTEILLDSPLQSITEGSQQQLTATFVYANGARRQARGVRWESRDPGILWVDGFGEAIGRQAGDVEVEVQGRGKSGKQRVKVHPGKVAQVTVYASATSLAVGDEGNVWAEIKTSKGEIVSKPVDWSSAKPSVIQVNADGKIKAMSPGTTDIEASVDGVVGTATLSVQSTSSGGSGGSSGGSGGSSGGGSSGGSGGSSGGSGGSSGGSGGSGVPGQVTDLRVSQTAERQLQLSFTQVDDGSGQPASYIIRIGDGAFTWDGSVAVNKGSCSAPVAGTEVGANLTCSVDGLVASKSYSFQLVARRSDANGAVFGPLSNIVTGTTDAPGLLVDVTPSAFQMDVGESKQLSAAITDTYGNAVSGSVTWTSTASAVASVSGQGQVTGNGAGNATIRAAYSGVGGSSSASVVQPPTDSSGSGAPSGGTTPPPPPPPPAGQFFSADFSSARTDADLQGMVNVATQANVHADPGVGMRYDFQAFPTRCNDQTLSSNVGLPGGTQEVWLKFRVRFSSNWRNDNPNCSSPTPAYKTVFADLNQKFAIQRFELVSGAQNQFMHAAGPGWPTLDNVPVSVVRGVGRIGGLYLYDGQWHDVEIHFAILPGDRALVQVRIDGTVSHNYDTSHSQSGLSSRTMTKIRIGANRNLGAVQLMNVWWDDFQIWVGNTNPGFGFPSPTSY